MKTITKYCKQNRKKKTPAEKRMFNLLLKWKIKFRSQRPIDIYIVDFLIPDRRLIIEVDGEYHKKQREYDKKREEYIRSKGFNIVRISNQEVLSTNCDELLDKILSYPEIPIDDWRKAYGTARY